MAAECWIPIGSMLREPPYTVEPTPASRRRRLLLIDGRLGDLRPVTGLLSERYAMSFATDGLGGVHRAQSQQPDLILMDTWIPGVIDGFTVCRLLKADAQTAAIPVIFISDQTEPHDRVNGLQVGAVDYICKPLWPEEVLARVRVHAPDHVPALASVALQPADPERAYVEAAKRLIGERLNALPCVSQLAREVGLGARRLSHLFRCYVGLTVQAYISEQRIRASFKLLEKTSMSVHAVALEVGFATPGNFATAFRARTGMTPLAWRKQRQLDF